MEAKVTLNLLKRHFKHITFMTPTTPLTFIFCKKFVFCYETQLGFFELFMGEFSITEKGFKIILRKVKGRKMNFCFFSRSKFKPR